MLYEDFKNKYNGRYIDYDKSYGNQCWDLVQQYFTECLGIPSSVLSGVGNVGNMLNEPKLSLLLNYFDEVRTNEMHMGDVCIWPNIPAGRGHIAIFDHWDGKSCHYLSQDANNRPTGVYISVTSSKGVMRAFRRKAIKEIEEYYPIPNYNNYNHYNKDSIVDNLKMIGVDSSYHNRTLIASHNNIQGYRGTTEQNVYMLNLLKIGKLRKI